MGKVHLPLRHGSAAVVLGLAFASGAGAQSVEVPIAFAENRGQFEPEVRFQARVPGLVTTVLADGLGLEGVDGNVRLRFGGGEAVRVEGRDPLRGRAHYLGERATRDVPLFGRVRLVELYPGVDLELHDVEGRLEYDLWFAPGADPGRVRLTLEGAASATIAADGALETVLSGGRLRQLAPRAWQVDEQGESRPVTCAWRGLGDGSFGFDLAGLEAGASLVIDPVLVYATHVGGSGADEAEAVFVDDEGCVYVTGWARSSDFPSTHPQQGGARGKEAVLFKLGPDGRELLYATTFGGRGDDRGVALQVTREHQAIVAGTTDSDDFPTTENAFGRAASGGSDGFVVKFSADGGELELASLVGGSADDVISAVALGAGGEVTLAGTTRSRDFPVSSGSYGTEPRGGRDVFVTRLGPRLERLVFSTRIGGSDDDECRAVAVDEEGSSYLTGRTSSHDFPTTLGAFDRERCGIDAFVTKLSGGGRTLLFSTFLGGSGVDEANGIAVDAEHQVVVVGWTQSLDFPFDVGTAPGRKDGFAVRIGPMGNGLLWAAPIGGGSADEALAVALEPDGSPWIVGRTRSSDFPVSRDAHQGRLAGASDGFAVHLSAHEGKSLYATLAGGEGDEELRTVHCDRLASAVIFGGMASGITQEQRGPLAGKHRGPADAFVLRFDPHATGPTTGLRAGLDFGF